MFGFIKKNIYIKKYIYINQECKIRPEIANVNSNEPSFYPYIISVNKCSGSSNNISDPHDPHAKKNIYIKKNLY